MEDHFSFSYPRYLEAKTTVDDRSLNRRVWTSFLSQLASVSDVPAILDVGGGTGATLLRVLNAITQRSIDQIDYTLIDPEPANVSAAADNLSGWAEAHDWTHRSDGGRHQLTENGDSGRVTVRFLNDGLFSHAEEARGGTYDAIVAQAVLDLFDVADAVQALNPCLRSGGIWYLPIHFDGLTALEPVIDASLDHAILERYHETIPTPQSGRALLTALPNAGAHLHAVGASDWIVHGREGAYPGDEAYFLKCILQFIHKEVSRFDDSSFSLSPSEWMRRRHQQLDEGTLIYLAHQLDICAVKG